MSNPKEEFIPTADAQSKLNLTEQQIRRLIQTKRLTWRESDDSVLLEDVNTQLELMEYDRLIASGLSEREVRKQIAARVRPEHPITRTPEHRNPAASKQSPNHSITKSPITHVSVNEAAQLLGVTRRQIFHLCQEGRLNFDHKGNRRLIWLSDIQDYQRLQQIWEDQGGDWSPYGRAPKIHTRTDLQSSTVPNLQFAICRANCKSLSFGVLRAVPAAFEGWGLD